MTDLVTALIETLDNGKADNINRISLAGKSDIADFLVIASGTSGRHVHALARQLIDCLGERNIKGIKPEGGNGDEWIVIDALDVIVHLFSPEMREFYDLDRMWQDIPLHNRDNQ